MDPRLTTMLADITTRLEAMQATQDKSNRRLESLERDRETSPERGRRHHNGAHNNRRDPLDLDDRYLKSIKIEVPTFDGRLEP